MKFSMLVSFFCSNMEGFFFGSGKAHVVTGVALIILAGLALTLWRMDRRLSKMEDDLNPPKS